MVFETMQYSLRTLMILMACVAFGCFALFVLPPPLSSMVLVFFFVLASTAVLSLLIYGEGNIRAFAFGCVLPLSWYWIMVGIRARYDLGFLFNMAFVTVASGFVSVGVRRCCVSKRAVDPSTADS